MANKITAVVTCYNIQDRIRRCLESLRWVDELLVVDSYSTDQTCEIAKEYADEVLEHEFENYGAQQRWAVPQAKNEWVLVVDSDEWVYPELAREIQSILQKGPTYNGYKVRRSNVFMGKTIRYCGWQRDTVVRFFHRDRHTYPDMQVHSDVRVEGPLGVLEGYLGHESYRDMEDYFERFVRFSRWGAMNAVEMGKRATLRRIFLHPIGRFIRMYFLQRGFLDGKAGLVLCMLASASVLAKYTRLWELEMKDKSGQAPCTSTDREDEGTRP